MAPPGIMSSQEQLDILRSLPIKTISPLGLSSSSSSSSAYKTSSSSSADMTIHSPSFGICPAAVSHDHDYVAKQQQQPQQQQPQQLQQLQPQHSLDSNAMDCAMSSVDDSIDITSVDFHDFLFPNGADVHTFGSSYHHHPNHHPNHHHHHPRVGDETASATAATSTSTAGTACGVDDATTSRVAIGLSEGDINDNKHLFPLRDGSVSSISSADWLQVCAGVSSDVNHASSIVSDTSDNCDSWPGCDDDEMMSLGEDGDQFLHGLDDLNLDLEDLAPYADVRMDDCFQSFIDETLNDSLARLAGEEGKGEEGEDTYKKEFFLKTLGLQSVAPQVTPGTECSSSSSLKQEEKQEDERVFGSLSIRKDFTNETQEASESPLPSSSSLSSLTCYTSLTASSFRSRSTDDPSGASWCLDASAGNARHNPPPQHGSTPSESDFFTHSSTSTGLHSSSSITTVPSKTCSRAVTDWKNSMSLYSTAPGCSNGRVQTHLCTASMPSSPVDNSYNSRSSTGTSTSISVNTRATQNESMFSDIDDDLDLNLFCPDGFPIVDASTTDQCNQDVDDFLRGLIDDDGEFEPSSSTPASGDLKTRFNFEVFEARNNSISSDERPIISHFENRTSVTNSSTVPVSPSSVLSFNDLDSFIDIESYATERSTPSASVEQMDRLHHLVDENDYCDSKSKSDNKTDHDNNIQSNKNSLNSELRFRLSLLDDLSQSFMSDRDLEKKDNSADLLCCDQLGLGTNATGGGLIGHRYDSVGDLSCDVSSSPLSPYSSSSVQSSVAPSPCSDANLELLGLFSEENSSLLMGRLNTSYSNVGVLLS